MNSGSFALARGDLAAARRLFEEGVALCRELGDKLSLASALHNLGVVADRLGDHAGAHALAEEALTACREPGDDEGIAREPGLLSLTRYHEGDLADAEVLAEQAVATARGLLAEAAALVRELGPQAPSAAEHIETLAALLLARHSPASAARLLGAAAAVRDALGTRAPKVDRESRMRVTAALSMALGEARFRRLLATGRKLSLGRAIALALPVERTAMRRRPS